jgi:hypothetical protein
VLPFAPDGVATFDDSAIKLRDFLPPDAIQAQLLIREVTDKNLHDPEL